MSKTKIADFIDCIGDGIHGTPSYDDNGEYYFINGNNLENGKIVISHDTLKINEAEYLRIKKPLNDNTILLSINGTLGRIALYNGEKIALGKSACYINVKSDKNKYFVKYILSTKEFQKYILLVAHGSTIKNLAPTQVAEYEFDIPENLNQDKVALLLKTIDEKIENNNAINAELESMAKTIYDYWFLQFEFPNEEGKPYKSSGGKMVWNEELKKAIPEGWYVGNLYDIADFTNGLACQKFRPISEDKKLPVVKIAEMHDGITESTEYVRDDIPEKNIICDGDILFSWSATLETMLWTGGKAGLNQHIFKVEPKNYAKYYVFMQLSAYIVNFVQMAEARKTTMGHITTDHLKQSRIAIPPKELTDFFNSQLESTFQQIVSNNEQNRELVSLRDFLLPLLMNGQVGFKSELREDFDE